MAFSEKTETLVNALVQAEYENACKQAGKEFCEWFLEKRKSRLWGFKV